MLPTRPTGDRSSGSDTREPEALKTPMSLNKRVFTAGIDEAVVVVKVMRMSNETPLNDWPDVNMGVPVNPCSGKKSCTVVHVDPAFMDTSHVTVHDVVSSETLAKYKSLLT